MVASVHPVAGPAAVRTSKCSKSRAQPMRWASACLVLAASVAPAVAYEASPRFLFISSPTKRKIYYAPLPSFDALSKQSEERKPKAAKVLIDGNPPEPAAVPTPAPAADDAGADAEATYDCSEGNTCWADQGEAWQTALQDNSREHAKDTEISKEECQSACSQATDCTGIEYSSSDAGQTCIFWLKNECDVSKAADNQGWQSKAGYTVCSQVAATTALSTTTTTTTVSQACASCLEQPEGIAMWHGRDAAQLYVADAVANRIVMYPITVTLTGDISAGSQEVVLTDIATVSGLTLDGFGNLYYATMDGLIGFLPGDKLYPLNSPVATTLYASDAQPSLSNPYALAADNFHVYWANQANGNQQGAVVGGFERDVEAMKEKYPDYPKAMAKNVAKAMGVCIAKQNVFFTAESQALYGVKTTGGAVTEVYAQFDKPRGCTYDGEATLYVADNAGTIYSLPGNFPTIRPVKAVQQVATCEEPGSVAVFTSADAYSIQSPDKGFLGMGW